MVCDYRLYVEGREGRLGPRLMVDNREQAMGLFYKALRENPGRTVSLLTVVASDVVRRPPTEDGDDEDVVFYTDGGFVSIGASADLAGKEGGGK